MAQQFTVEHIWPLDPTKKSGGFKGTDGVNYYCEIGAYGLLQKGTTYTADVRPYVSKAGKQSFIVDKAWHPPATVAGNGAASAQPAPQPQPQAVPPVQPAPSTGNGTHTKDAAMFVMGVVGRAMGSGKFDTQDIPLLAKAAAAAWNEVKGQL